MEEKSTFVVNISHLQATLIALVALANIALIQRIYLRFPDGKGYAFTVTSWEPLLVLHYPTVLFDFKSIRNLTWDASVNMASEMQVQRLIDYYNLNYLLTFKKD